MKLKNNYILFFIALLISSLFIPSCGNRPSNVLSQKKMENLLVEVHMLEGSLRAKGYYHYGEDEKMNPYYAELFNKYNITRVEFDSCLSWYTRNPKQFERIYANVITRIESLRTDVEKGKFHPIDSTLQSGLTDLWNLQTRYVFTKDSVRNNLHFEIINSDLMSNDRYELSFLHRVAPSDSSLNQHAVLYVNYLNGLVDSIYTLTKNDSVLRKYTLKFKARHDLKIESLSGYILGNDSSLGKMGAYVDSVKLTRRFNPYRQDSIRAVVNKLDTTTIKLPADTTQILDTQLDKKTGKRELRKLKIREL